MIQGGVALRDLGWKRVHRSTPVGWIMTEDVATQPSYGGSTYAELDALEQRIMDRFPAPRNFIWRYVKINENGDNQICNLQPPTAVSRFVAIDAKKRKYEETRELVDDDDGTDGTLANGVSVVAASGDGTPSSPDDTVVVQMSPNTPPKNTCESLAEKPHLEPLVFNESGALQSDDGGESEYCNCASRSYEITR